MQRYKFFLKAPNIKYLFSSIFQILVRKKRERNYTGSFSPVLRKMRDSNPRYPEKGIPDFESSAFDHSANLPFCVCDCKGNNNLEKLQSCNEKNVRVWCK